LQVRHELRPLTSARGLAAWYIVLYHIRLSAAGSLPQGVIDFFAKGYLAVDFFFVLSGFVIWLNYRTLFEEHRWRSVPHFFWRRLARIYPLHLLMMVIAIAFALVCVATGRPLTADYQWSTLPFHLLLVQNWGFLDELGWNVPAWSISCELGAYLAFPLLMTSIDWQKCSSAVLLAILATLMVGLFGVFAWAGKDLLGNDIPHLGLPRCLFEFAMGTIVAALWLRWRQSPNRPAILSAIIGAGALAAYFAGGLEIATLPLFFVCLLLLLALTADRPNPLKGKIIHWFGEFSYATYLAHALLFIFFKIAFVSDVDNVPLPVLGLFLLVVLAASALLYHGFELPAQKWMNRHGPRRPGP
jgi:peptidoglycan/LPS O-acetylase OafA/YrhL